MTANTAGPSACMWSRQPLPPPFPATPHQQVLCVADRLQAPRVVAAAGARLAAAVPLDWDTVLTVYALPPGCRASAAYTAAFKAADATVERQLGNIDVALNSEERRACLLALPLQALAALLRSDKTCVSCEEQVVWLCDAWLAAHKHGGSGSGGSNSSEDDEDPATVLAGCIRFLHVDPLYLASVVAHLPWLAACPAWRAAAAYHAAPQNMRGAVAKLGAPGFEGLARPERAAASGEAGPLAWDVTASEVAHVVCEATDEADGLLELPQLRVWRGYAWHMVLCAGKQDRLPQFGVSLWPEAPGKVGQLMLSVGLRLQADHDGSCMSSWPNPMNPYTESRLFETVTYVSGGDGGGVHCAQPSLDDLRSGGTCSAYCWRNLHDARTPQGESEPQGTVRVWFR